MWRCHSIEALGFSLRDIIQNTHLFGGKELLFAGDFRQKLSVVPSGYGDQIASAYVRSSFIYHILMITRLSESIRRQALLHGSDASEELTLFSQFCVKDGRGDVFDDISIYIDLQH